MEKENQEDQHEELHLAQIEMRWQENRKQNRVSRYSDLVEGTLDSQQQHEAEIQVADIGSSGK